MFFDHILNWSHLVNKNVCTVRKFKIFKYYYPSVCLWFVERALSALFYYIPAWLFLFFFLLNFIKKNGILKKNIWRRGWVFFLNKNSFLLTFKYSHRIRKKYIVMENWQCLIFFVKVTKTKIYLHGFWFIG
jgi:hypothetical protein